MIAIESFRKYKIKDLIAIFILVGIWALFSSIGEKYFGGEYAYYFSLLLASIMVSLGILLMRKFGAAVLIYLMGGIFGYAIPELGVVGLEKIYVLLIAGIIFELAFLILRIELKDIQIDIALGSALSAASIPLSTSILLSWKIALSMLTSMINLVLASFFIGLMGAVISFMLWSKLRNKKFILRFEYGA